MARLRERVERCAAFLRWIGIGRGDVVTIQLPTRIAFPIVFFALELVGAIANKVIRIFASASSNTSCARCVISW